MKGFLVIVLTLCASTFKVEAQTWTGTSIEFYHPTLGANGDYTSFYRADATSDRVLLRLRLGDEETSDFQVGHTHWQTGLWQSNLTLDGNGNAFIRGNVGIGTATPGGKLEVNGAGSQIRLSGGTVAAGLWTNATDILYLADWNSGTKGLNVNMSSGNVGIGTANPDQRLTVNGKIKAEEVQVVVDVPADYVFDSNYKLAPLNEVEMFIKTNSHLPGIPNATTLKTNGWAVGEMSNKLLEKVEELTLYLIELKKENEELRSRLEKLENKK